MLIEPRFEAFSRGVLYHGVTIFDGLTVFARWEDKLDAYRLAHVTLTYRPKTFSMRDDERYKPKSFGLGFDVFASRVQEALAQVEEFQAFRFSLPSEIKSASKLISPSLMMKDDGVYLREWPHAPIFHAGVSSPKCAAWAMMELIELEAKLPAQKV